MKRSGYVLLLILAGCEPDTPPQPETDRAAASAFDTQIHAVRDAQAVEQRVLDAAAGQRKQIDAVEGQ
jgi:hypothetical protein